MDGFYNNSMYSNNRNRKKTLMIDLNDSDNTNLGSGTEFKIDLREPFIIDKHSEVYLDNFNTFNSNLGDTHNQTAFALRINEFNIKSGVASNTSGDEIDGAIIIPNDNNDINNYFGTVSHKSKKFNYICDINPIRLTSISGKITDLSGDPIFHGSASGTQYTYALIGISSWTFINGDARPLTKGEVVTINPGTGVVNITILNNTGINASTIYFTSATNIVPSVYTSTSITITATAYVFTVGSATHSNIHLIKGNGRFTAEFSIVSRE